MARRNVFRSVMAMVTGLILVACSQASQAGSPSPSAPVATSLTASPTPAPVSLAGHIVFDRERGDFGYERPYDGTWIIGSGEPMRQLSIPYEVDGGVSPAWSPDGKRLLVNLFVWPDIPGRPAIVGTDGSDLRILEPRGLHGSLGCFDWSPDGKRLVCSLDDDQRPKTEGIWELSLTDMALSRVTISPNPSVEGGGHSCGGNDFAPAYSPDGGRIAFVRAKCGTDDNPVIGQSATLCVVNRDGSGLKTLTRPGDIGSHGFSRVRWSPDGSQLLYTSEEHRLRLVSPDGGRPTSIPLELEVPGATSAYSATWSPDGFQLLFSFMDGSGTALYVADRDGSHMTAITESGNAEVGANWTAH
jgi:Tol biopolymer transport system component